MKKKLSLLFFLPVFLMGFFAEGQIRVKGRTTSREVASRQPPALASNTILIEGTDSATVSAGAYYKTDSSLARTLFNNERFAPGTYTIPFDGLADDGITALDTSQVYIQTVTSRMDLTWQGVIGNTSRDLVGKHVWRSYQFPYAFVNEDGKNFIAAGYAEGQPEALKMFTATPQVKYDVVSYYKTAVCTGAATDGVNVYWAVYDSRGTNKSLVFATRVDNDAEVTFSSGTATTLQFSRTYNSAIGVIQHSNATQAYPSAIAVNASYIFVSYPNRNEIRVINKTTGAAAQTISGFTNPKTLDVDLANNKLWLDSNGTVKRYPINPDGTLGASELTLSGVVSPVRVRANGSAVAVADAGTSQQVKFFNSSGVLQWTFGTAGGYNNSPEVTNTKFCFSTLAGNKNVDIDFEPDGSFWLLDGGNYRFIKFNSSREHQETVAYLPSFRSVSTDPADPTRVFAMFLEYKVDYTKPLGPNNGSWFLKNNWSYNIASSHYGEYDRFDRVATIQGQTFATASNNIYHLKNDGTGVRDVGLIPGNNPRVHDLEYNLFKDGSLRTADGGRGDEHRLIIRNLYGLNGSGDPVWGTDSVLVSIPGGPLTDSLQPIYGPSGTFFPRPFHLTGNLVWTFNHMGDNRGSYDYHLGSIKLDGTPNTWHIKTARSTKSSYKGDFPYNGWFDRGNDAGYHGNRYQAFRDSILYWGYHGEFWKGASQPGQANKFTFLHKSGLMLGQTGFATWELNAADTASINGYSPAGLAGNALSQDLANVADSTFLYYCDEGVHGGIHRLRITGFPTIQVKQHRAVVYNPAKPYEDLMAGITMNETELVSGAVPGWTLNRAIDTISGTTSYFSVKTGVMDYQEPSLRIHTNTTGAGNSGLVTRTWNSPNQLGWDINFDASFDNTDIPGTPGSNWGSLQWLGVSMSDSSNNRIVNILFEVSTFSPRTYVLKINGTTVLSAAALGMKQTDFVRFYFYKWQNISISPVDANQLLVKFGPHSWTVNKLSGSNLEQPKKMELGSGTSAGETRYRKVINIRRFRKQVTGS